MVRTAFCRAAASAIAALVVSAGVSAQTAPMPSQPFPMPMDSGLVQGKKLALGPGEAPELVYSNEVRVMGAPWLRLMFDEVTLAGSPDLGDGAYMVITSLRDGAKQRLNAQSIREWSNSSAYFNGDAVKVEVFAYPLSGVSRVRMSQVIAGAFTGAGNDTICGNTDDRTLSTHPAQGRIAPIGCTGWLITNGNCANRFLSAGHCFIPAPGAQVMEFNCPLSTAGGAIVHPPPEHQYAIDMATVQATQTVIGNDFSQFFTFANSNTGLHARDAQGGAAYTIGNAPAVAGQTLRITGYGTTNPSDPIAGGGLPLTQSQVQKTHTGAYTLLSGTRMEYTVDTTGGNSGSPVVNGTSPFATAIGIHTNAGCTTTGGANSGTAIQNAGLQAAIAAPLGACAAYTAPACFQSLFASNNGGAAGGAVYFDLSVAGTNDLEITHIFQNVALSGVSFNVEIYITPDTSVGKETNAAAWTLVATGSGMGEVVDTPSLVALSNRFTLLAGTRYGVAIKSNLQGNEYTNGIGTNEVYANSNFQMEFGKASNVAFAAPLFAERVWNGRFCYNVKTATANCLQTLYATNNGGSNGGAVYFDANVSAAASVIVNAVSVNASAVAGTPFNVTVYRKNGTYAGFEGNIAAWTQVATGSGTAAGSNIPSVINLSNWLTLAAGSNNGFAIVMDAASGHSYTNGTGANQVYSNPNLTISTGSATNAPFDGAPFSPRVFNGALCYTVQLGSCQGPLAQQVNPNPTLGGYNSNAAANVSTQQVADNFSVASNSVIKGLRLWAVYTGGGLVPSPTQNFTVNIFGDSAGNPGALLYSSAASATVNQTGLIMTGFGGGRALYQYDISLPSFFNATAGTQYWLSPVGTSDNYTWCWQFVTNPVGGTLRVRNDPLAAWGSFANSASFQVCGTPPCYANCDNSVVPPVLNALDFSCFLTRFAANDPYANCDNSVVVPVLNALDFSCFLTKFAQGCP